MAQSAAAIVGLLGAIVATHLQNQIADAKSQRLAVSDALRILHEYVAPLDKPLLEYLKNTDHQQDLLRQALTEGHERMKVPTWFAHVEKSVNADVEVSERMLDIERQRSTDAKLLSPLIAAALRDNSVDAVNRLVLALDAAMPQVSPQTRSQAVATLGRGRDASRELSILALRTATRSYWMLWVCLALLSAFGLVVPLAYLSAHSTWHKVLLLLGFAVALVVLLAFLARQIWVLGRAGTWRSVLPPSHPELAA